MKTMGNKVKSVLELGRYKVGNKVWWVVLRPKSKPEAYQKEDEWMEEYHGKIKLERGPWKKVWKKNIRVPRLHHVDFNNITGLLTQKLIVEEFNVNDICRSCQTGEYFYANEDYEWMPETFLFDSVVAARREKTRILKMLKGWTRNNG